MVRQGPTNDPAGAKIDHDRQIDPTGRGRNEGNIASPDLVGLLRKWMIEEEIGRRSVGSAVTGLWCIGFGLNGFESALRHDSTDPGRSTENALIGKILADSSVAITTAVTLEDRFDNRPYFLIRTLGGSRLRRVIIAAAWDSQSDADSTDGMAGSLVNFANHFPELV